MCKNNPSHTTKLNNLKISKKSAFTLIEILVALMVLGVFVSALAKWMQTSNQTRIQSAISSASVRIFSSLEKDILAGRSIINPATLSAQLTGAELLSFVSDPSGLLQPKYFKGEVHLKPITQDGLAQGRYDLKICYQEICLDKTIISKIPVQITSTSTFASYHDQGTLIIQFQNDQKPVNIYHEGEIIKTITTDQTLTLDNGVYQLSPVDNTIQTQIDPSIVTIEGGKTTTVKVSFDQKTTGLQVVIDPKLPIAPEVSLEKPDGSTLTVRESRVWRDLPSGTYGIQGKSFDVEGFAYIADAIEPFILTIGQQEIKRVHYVKQSAKLSILIEGYPGTSTAPILQNSAGESWNLKNGSNDLELKPDNYQIVTVDDPQYRIEIDPASQISLKASDQKQINITYQEVYQNSIGIYFDHDPNHGEAKITGDNVDLSVTGNSRVENLADGDYYITSFSGTPTPDHFTLSGGIYKEVHIK